MSTQNTEWKKIRWNTTDIHWTAVIKHDNTITITFYGFMLSVK